ncbi:hypothetical protein ACHHYP_05475 [Achlya hypogyna]|uniref:Uncharacterized protein n=1 Tax=Achlya hypogyna TaxID=1202772 RepID=A0A1V9YY68_ACHHY|nr:hypothetical protein ACHHYP_05475 [Achlya hypogyna]
MLSYDRLRLKTASSSTDTIDAVEEDGVEDPNDVADAASSMVDLLLDDKISQVIHRLTTSSVAEEDLTFVRLNSTVLSEAAVMGNYTIVKLLLENTPYWTIPDYKWSPAIGATMCDRPSILQLLSEVIPNLHEARDPEDGDSLLHVSVRYMSNGVLQWLLPYFKQVDIFNGSGLTPLHVSAQCGAQCGNEPALQHLVRAGADINIKSKDGASALHMAVTNPHTESTYLNALLVAGADMEATDKDGQRPVDLCQNVEMTNMLKKEAEFRKKFPLHYMARGGRPEPVVAWIKTTMGGTPITEIEHPNKVEVAVRETDSTSEAGLTVLMHAANALDYTTGDQVLDCLLPYCSSETVLMADSNGHTVLDYLLDKKVLCVDKASSASNVALLRSIENVCHQAKVPVNAAAISPQSLEGTPPRLCCGACQSSQRSDVKFTKLAASKNWDELQALLRSNPDEPSINDYDDEGYTVLHRVAQHGHAPTLKLLLQQTKLDINLQAKSVGFDAAVTLAAKANRVNCVRLLLQAGADTDLLYDTTEVRSLSTRSHISQDDINELRVLASPSQNLIYDRWELQQRYPAFALAGLLNIQAALDAIQLKQSPLHVAVRTAQPVHVLEELLAETNDVDAQDSEGMTALMVAAHEGQLANVRFLLSEEVDANVDLRNESGETALMHAAASGHVEVVDALVAAFADLHIQDAIGATVQDQLCRRIREDESFGKVDASSPFERIIISLYKEEQMRATAPNYKEKMALSMISLTTEEVFGGNGFAKALACSTKLAQTFLSDCVQLDRHEAQFFKLDLVYGQKTNTSALHAVLNVETDDPDQSFDAKRDCLEHIVMRRLLEIKWELFGQRKYIEQLLMNLLLLLTMTTSSILFHDETPPVVAFYLGIAAVTFVVVSLAIVQALRPEVLWRLARFTYDGRLSMSLDMAIPDLPMRKIFLRRCFCLLVLAVTVAAVVPTVMVLRQLNMETRFSSLNHGVLGITAMYFVVNEVQEMRSSVREYLSSRMNQAQMRIYLLILFLFVPMKLGLIDAAFELQVGVGGFLTLALWVLSLQFIEVVPSASYLLPMMADLFGDIYNFFILFGVFQVGLTITFYQLFRRQADDTAFSSLGQSFLTTYFVMFGQVPLDSLSVFADSSMTYSEAMYVATAVLMMLHSAVVVVVLLNVLLALMNQTVTTGLAKAKTQALASYASCILRLEGAMALSEDETVALMHFHDADGRRVLNPIFTERVPKSTLGLSAELTEALLASAADRQEWAERMLTLDKAIDEEFTYLIDALNHTGHFIDLDVAVEFAAELEVIATARAQFRDVVDDARKSRGQYKDKVLAKVRARTSKELAKFREHLLATWKPKDDQAAKSNHSKCVLLFELAQRSGLDTLLDKVSDGITTAVETSATDKNEMGDTDDDEENDEEMNAKSKLEADVGALKELIAAQATELATVTSKLDAMMALLAKDPRDDATASMRRQSRF